MFPENPHAVGVFFSTIILFLKQWLQKHCCNTALLSNVHTWKMQYYSSTCITVFRLNTQDAFNQLIGSLKYSIFVKSVKYWQDYHYYCCALYIAADNIAFLGKRKKGFSFRQKRRIITRNCDISLLKKSQHECFETSAGMSTLYYCIMS